MGKLRDNVPDPGASAEIDRLLSQSGPGEEQVVEAMVAVYRAGLYRFACSVLGDPDEAEDAVQQAFIQAAVHLGRYRPGTNFKAWLYTIAVNACRGMLRRRKARQALARLLGREARPSARPADWEERLEQREAAGRLWSAVMRLEEKYRLVVVLRFEQELAIAEIAQVLSIPSKTVYSRLYEALHRLRSELAGEMGEPGREKISLKEAAP